MADVTPEILAEGQAPVHASIAALYTVPASTYVYGGILRVLNGNTTDEVFRWYLTKSGGTRRLVGQMTLAANNGWAEIGPFDLNTADVLSWSTTTATQVNGVFQGRKRA